MQYEVEKHLIKDLLDYKESRYFREYWLTDEKLDKLFESKIFVYHPMMRTISFHSQSVENYFRENADKFIK